MRKILLLIFMLIFILSGCVSNYKYQKIEAIVVDKEYQEEYTTTAIISAGKIMVPTTQIHPAEYNVKLVWNNIYTTIDDERLFKNYNKNDKIKAYVRYGYNKKNELENTNIVLEKR